MGSAGSGRAGRIALYLLVLNVLVLAGGLGLQYVNANRMPGIREINPEKIHLWAQPAQYQAAPPEKTEATGDTLPKVEDTGPVSDATAGAPAAAVGTGVAASDAKPSDGRLCILVDDLSQAHYKDLQTLRKSNGLTDEKCTYIFDKALAWWVFWPPEYEPARRDKVVEQIHAAGVKDILPITQGAMAQAFSVGVFKSETQAQLYRNQLRSKGLDKIEYGPRPSVGSVKLGCDIADPKQLEKAKAGLPSWAKAVAPEACRASP